jgi:hypothetical protein
MNAAPAACPAVLESRSPRGRDHLGVLLYHRCHFHFRRRVQCGLVRAHPVGDPAAGRPARAVTTRTHRRGKLELLAMVDGLHTAPAVPDSHAAARESIYTLSKRTYHIAKTSYMRYHRAEKKEAASETDAAKVGRKRLKSGVTGETSHEHVTNMDQCSPDCKRNLMLNK